MLLVFSSQNNHLYFDIEFFWHSYNTENPVSENFCGIFSHWIGSWETNALSGFWSSSFVIFNLKEARHRRKWHIMTNSGVRCIYLVNGKVVLEHSIYAMNTYKGFFMKSWWNWCWTVGKHIGVVIAVLLNWELCLNILFGYKFCCYLLSLHGYVIVASFPTRSH